jgi:hypothetical protein
LNGKVIKGFGRGSKEVSSATRILALARKDYTSRPYIPSIQAQALGTSVRCLCKARCGGIPKTHFRNIL